MDVKKLAEVFNAEMLEKIFSQLPSGQRNILADHGTPEEWSQKIGTLMPPGSDPVRIGITSRIQQLAAAAVESNRQSGMTPSKKIQSLIEDGDSAHAAAEPGQFLNRQPGVDVRRR
jgi:hypothetical protein